MAAGDCVVIPPGTPHKLWAGSRTPRSCCCAAARRPTPTPTRSSWRRNPPDLPIHPPDAPFRSPPHRGSGRPRLGAPAAGALTIGIADQKADMFSDVRFQDTGITHARLSVPWDALRGALRAPGPRRVDAGRPRRGRQPADLLRPLRGEPPQAADARALPLRVPPLPRRLPVGPRLRDLERGQPLRRADLPPPRAGRRLLPQAARGVPEVPHPRRRAARHAQHGHLGQGLPPRRDRAAEVLGPAQLPRRQPPAHDGHAPRCSAATTGQIWFTETGGIVSRTNRARSRSPSRPRTRRSRPAGCSTSSCR